jgi:hypothetical protein
MPRQTHTLAPTRSWANKERRGETLGFRHYWNNSPSQDWDRIAPGLRCPKKTTAPLLDPIHGWGRLASPSLPCRNLLPNLENPMVPPGPGPAGPAHAPVTGAGDHTLLDHGCFHIPPWEQGGRGVIVELSRHVTPSPFPPEVPIFE